MSMCYRCDDQLIEIDEWVEGSGSAHIGITPCRGAAVQGRAAPSEAISLWTAAPRYGTHGVGLHGQAPNAVWAGWAAL
jgi:hypothetical protein